MTPDHAGARLTIDLGAIGANWRLLSARVGRPVAAVVKADAYGLGAARVAPALAALGCTDFFVAHLAEAIALRPLLPQARLHVLGGLMPGAEADCAALGIVPVLNSPEQIAAWAATAARLGRALPGAIQIDTGMSRLGLAPAEMEALTPADLRGIDPTLLLSHLACADSPGHPANAAQLARFRAARARLPAIPASLANSSGIFLGPDFHFDLARPGAALYGVNPCPGQPNPMRAVVRLQARVIQCRDIAPGTGVGYGLTWTATRPTRIATVAVGYADGYLRALSGRGTAWVGPTALPVLGRVSMDTLTLDASALAPDALPPGALVDLLGPGDGLDTLAAQAGTIGYEILTSLGQRYARHWHE